MGRRAGVQNIIDMKCSHCGGPLSAAPGSRRVKCDFCEHEYLIDNGVQDVRVANDELRVRVVNGIQDVRVVNGEEFGYSFEKGRQKAQRESGWQANVSPATSANTAAGTRASSGSGWQANASPAQSPYQATCRPASSLPPRSYATGSGAGSSSARAASPSDSGGLSILQVLAWILFFPFKATRAALKSSLSGIAKAFVVAIIWVPLFLFGSVTTGGTSTFAGASGSPSPSTATPSGPVEHTHTWDGGIVTSEPSCASWTDGVRLLTCTTCGLTMEVPVSPFHAFEEEVLEPPTCLAGGTLLRTCTECGHTETQPLLRVGHRYIEEILRPASCKASGLTRHTCEWCGDTYTEEIFIEHTWVAATCTKPKTCSVCGTTDGKALGHTVDVGTCTRCGQELWAKSPVYIKIRTAKAADGSVQFFFTFTNTGSEPVRYFYVKWQCLDKDGNVLFDTITRVTEMERSSHPSTSNGISVSLQPGTSTKETAHPDLFHNDAFASVRIIAVSVDYHELTAHHYDIANVPVALG